MKIFYINIRTAFGNSGDALINRELICALRQYGSVRANCSPEIPTAFLEDLQLLPTEMLQVKNTAAFNWEVFRAGLHSRNSGRQIFCVGGLGDCYGGSWKIVAKDLAAAAVYAMYKLAGVKIITIGRSFGKLFPAREVSERLRSLFADGYYVRDAQSLSYCHEIGISRAQLCPDLSWMLPHEKEQPNQMPCVALTFRASAGNYRDEAYEQNLLRTAAAALEAIRDQLGRDIQVLLFHQVDRDAAFMDEMHDFLARNTDFHLRLIPERMRLKDADAVYGGAMFHISNRLHSLLLGFKYGSVPIALVDSSNRKIVATLDDATLDDLILRPTGAAAETSGAAKSIVNRREELFVRILRSEAIRQKEMKRLLDVLLLDGEENS